MSDAVFGKLKPKAFSAIFIGKEEEYLITRVGGSVTLIYEDSIKGKTNRALAFRNYSDAIRIANEIILQANNMKKAEQFHRMMIRKESPTCLYSIPWVGSCGKTSVVNETIGLCEEHSKATCSFCKKQAIEGCSHAGQFVCGRPLCGECKCKH